MAAVEQLWLNSPDSRTNILPHVLAYAHALPNVWGKRVADLCCGTGYGTKLLAEVAKVDGFDISEDTIKFAIQGDKFPFFFVEDVEQGDYSSYEAITCMQGLEHLDNPKGLIAKYLDKLWVVALPNDQNDSNPYHHHRITTELIRDWFDDVDIHYFDDSGRWEPQPFNNFTNFFAVYKP